MKQKTYKDINVLEASKKRISYIFDNFKNINISISGGKDSTVLYYLVLQEAIKRNRQFTAFFLDQEAEYENTIKIIKLQMNNKYVIPNWYQIPIYMTNATSIDNYFLYAWGENEKWMREKNPLGIHSIKEQYPKRFYDFFNWYEKNKLDTAFLVGLRADESLTRFRAVTKYKGYNGLKWSSGNEKTSYKFYPIYDWGCYDVWKFIYEYKIPYNKIYDLMFKNNYSIYNAMRVSNLIHEKAYKCLIDLPKFEPDTYNKLCKRISGISTASRYASEKLIFSNKNLPKHYKCWLDFRNFLLNGLENEHHKDIFIKRFGKQPQNEKIYQKQVGQLLINDYENSKSFDLKEDDKKQQLVKKWMEDIL